MTIIGVQRRMMELGRIRMGDKKGKGGSQRKLTAFRLTSASQQLLQSAAAIYGGEVHPWDDAPDEGYFELYTEADELDILLPPVYSQADGTPALPYSQWFELWSAAGCQRRCDGVNELLSGGGCLCDPDDRQCDITTRLNVILPRVPGIGTWLLQSKGWNAANVLPGTLDVLLMAASQQQFIPAVLRLEQRTKKVPGEGTRRFVVPVVDVPGISVGDMLGELTPSPPSSALPATYRPAEIAAGATPPAQPEPTVALPQADEFGPQPELGGEADQGESLTPEPGQDSAQPGDPEARRIGQEEWTEAEAASPASSPEEGEVEMANADDRRGIFELASAKGVDEAALKEILVSVSGQDSTRELPREKVEDVIAAINAA